MADKHRTAPHKFYMEVWPDDIKNHPFTSITVGDEEIFKINQDCTWEIRRIFVDDKCGNNHEMLAVVFGRKEAKE